MTYTCTVCNHTETKALAIVSHADADNDGVCDMCGEKFEAACTHFCHRTGFWRFIYKIACIFWKIGKTNQTCECGAAHY